MSTRKADPNAPLSQERYMSSPEYAALRGVSAVAVAARAAVILHAEKRRLVWFLQGMSIADGGLRKVAEDLIAMFPDRIDKDSLGLARHGEPTAWNVYGHRCSILSLQEFLIDLCINPTIQLRGRADSGDFDEIERDRMRANYSELSQSDIKPVALPYFKDILGALIEYSRRHQKNVKERFVLTAIGRQIWQTLDFALSTGTMVLLDGLEGRGKTEAIKAWCQLHLGEARFVSLRGITNKTTAFREISKALGIARGDGYKAGELQGRIEDVLQRSKLMLVVDEAHFIFNQGNRVYTRPELVDWIDTSIANRKIPIALVTTPQFMICMTRAASQVDWNYRQFRRRVRRYVKLPAKNTPRDIEAVIRSVLPGAPNSAVKQVLSYVHLTRRDLSAVGDVVDEIKARQSRDILEKVTYEDVTAVIDEYLVPSEKNFVEAITDAEARMSGKAKRMRQVAIAPAAESPGAEDAPSETESEGLTLAEDNARMADRRGGIVPRFEDNLITS
jgi:hypothetical protein